MIQRKYFKQPYTIVNRFNQFLMRYSDIYAIESIYDQGIVYGISNGKFAMITMDGILMCNFDETIQMANMMVSEIKWEMIEIYWYIKELVEKYGYRMLK